VCKKESHDEIQDLDMMYRNFTKTNTDKLSKCRDVTAILCHSFPNLSLLYPVVIHSVFKVKIQKVLEVFMEFRRNSHCIIEENEYYRLF
jgi:hypothetical protein